MNAEVLDLSKGTKMSWKILSANFNCSVKACNFIHQISDTELLMFGGWFKGKTQTSLEVFNLEKLKSDSWGDSLELKEPDMITKRPVVIGSVLAI